MNAEPSWDLYRTFEAVLREGSLSGAARALGLTQPSVARHIDALEAAIGADLFIRSQRGLSPTEVALELRPYAESIAATSAALLRTASGRSDQVSGTVRVTASEVIGVEHLPPILTRLRQRHPSLTLELTLSNAVDDLLQRKADIAVRNIEPVQQALVAKRAGSIVLGLHARRDYLERRGTPTTLDELRSHDLIGYDSEEPAVRRLVERYPMLDRASLALRADSHLAQLAAIRAGFGIGVCQAVLAQRDPELVQILAHAFSVELGAWIVMHEDLRTSPRCRVVFDALATEISSGLMAQRSSTPA